MQGGMPGGGSPTDVFSRADAVEKGETSRLMAFMGAVAVADVVKTTLGPKGMDKILQSQDPSGGTNVVVTNDGATILKSLHIDNPAARILVDISMTQDAEVGDGTTSVVVLAGELLREGDRLTQMKIHPQTIVRGWRKALKVAMGALEGNAVNNGQDPKAFREDLMNIAKTTLSSKVVHSDLEKFANICVDAVLRLKGGNLEQIKIIKAKGGQLRDSFLDPGFILPKSIGVGQAKVIDNPKILVANTPMDTDKIKIFGARVRVNAISEVAKIEKAEKAKMRQKVEKILAHKPDVFINRQLIYNYPEQIFTDAGVISIEHADFEGVEQLANVLGAEIASTFDGKIQLGTCERLEEIMIGEDRFLRFSGVLKGEACSIVLRGSSVQIQGEAERSIHDALCVLTTTVKDTRTVLGGGCSEMLMACAVDNLAKLTSGKEALAIEAFANALRQIPTILANNGGYDSSELVTQLRAAHNNGKSTFGLDMNNGVIACLRELEIVESFKSKAQALTSAHEAAEMILRVDDTIRAMPRAREDPNQHRH